MALCKIAYSLATLSASIVLWTCLSLHQNLHLVPSDARWRWITNPPVMNDLILLVQVRLLLNARLYAVSLQYPGTPPPAPPLRSFTAVLARHAALPRLPSTPTFHAEGNRPLQVAGAYGLPSRSTPSTP